METSVWKRKINILLLGIPLVLFRGQIPLGEGLENYKTIIVFILSAASLIPLAGFLESAVEELAELLGDLIGGLLHTTATNIAELTLSLFILLAFTSGEGATESGATVVEGTIAGVIIRNSLLFLGLATFLGCWRNGRMKFSQDIATDFSTVFALAVTGLSLPTLGKLIQSEAGGNTEEELGLAVSGHFVPFSLILAAVLLTSYLAFIVFSVFRFRAGENLQERARIRRILRHRQRQGHAGDSGDDRPEAAFGLTVQPDVQALFKEERQSAEARLSGVHERPEDRPKHGRAKLSEERRRAREARGEEGFLAGNRVGRGLLAALILAVATGGVALMSEGFADSVKELLEANANLEPYQFFLGLILIPLLAGIVELYGSVGMARRKRMDITMEITAGATIQMILLIVPILVIVGALTGHPIDLIFAPLEVIVFGAATFTFMLLSRDGESTILEGVQLCTLWLLFAVAAFFLPPLLS